MTDAHERWAEIIDDVFDRFQTHGAVAYLGEPVSVAEHMLQSAHAAQRDGAGPTLIAAALLHDIGHLLVDGREDPAERGIDSRHEELGFRFVSAHFVGAVAEPVRLHVAAKRYLCAVDPGYLRSLSRASTRSLELQGGPFAPDEVARFAALPHARDAIRLRRYDDVGKTPGAWTPNLAHYRPILLCVLRQDPNVR